MCWVGDGTGTLPLMDAGDWTGWVQWCSHTDFVTERLTVKGTELSYIQHEGAFCQPNAGICVSMLEWALDVTAPSPPDRPNKDLLELYCGNGASPWSGG